MPVTLIGERIRLVTKRKRIFTRLDYHIDIMFDLEEEARINVSI